MKKLLAVLLAVVFLGLCVFCGCSTSTSETSKSDSNTIEYELVGGESRTSTYFGSTKYVNSTIIFSDPVQNDNSFWAVYKSTLTIGNAATEIKGPFVMDDNTITITDNENGDSITLEYVYDDGEFIITYEDIGVTYKKLY